MPIGPYKIFADCVKKIKRKKKWKGKQGTERAKKYCGAIQKKVEGSKKRK